MPRETKTKSEIEALILEQVKSMPNGEHVEDVTLEFGDRKSELPLIGLGYVINNGSMADIMSRAISLGEQYCREYDVTVE
ncbi:hypothetical protein LNAOJCKE_3043 [Methylorubrum aminovorans]|uniref:Uncharacterized protein n=1 Tax=Methylorubrum aminovorans TaxID=269069 RepID=A0ABQ4UET7_9HYPH|nr:hypothetical protein [Methylorubrum aminovorans]GJE65830.1 hypothetical protein LNAOJCKE_3043 [Methylorubrum aminovorans]GMA75816.1 hypothetical protein GCM10025880_22330 [Methylorubrum aminovorans]